MGLWGMLALVAHILFIPLALRDLDSQYRRRPRSEWGIRQGHYPGWGTYPGYFMAGLVLVLLVPVLGEVMWFFLRREIGRV
jgi:hypothetical protein